jgi:predicted MFS family arabinose efflux permease
MVLGRVRPMHRQVLLLAAAQALVQTASTLVITVGGLAAVQTARAHDLATAPIASMFLGTVATIVPASIWMARSGRRPGFIAGALLGALGGALAAVGVYSGSLVVLCFGTLLVGAYQASAQFYRFAASEVADDAFRPRAISLVLAGGVGAALLGPAFARSGAPLFRTAFVGSFLIVSVTSLAAAGLLLGLRVPTPKAESGGNEGRPLLAILRQPTYAVALLGAATGSGVMVLAMTATPLAMVDHHHTLSEAAIVIQLHVLGMFLPSFVTGSLIERFGVVAVMFTGAALMSGHVVLSLAGAGFGSFASALFLLGVGWNFLYVGGTTLLTRAYLPAERGRAQAANDLLIYVVGLASSLSAGALLNWMGWRLMNALVLPWLLVAMLAVAWLAYRGRAFARGHAA